MNLWIHWIRPQAFWLLLLIIPIFWLGRRSRSSKGQWTTIVDAHLLPYLLVKSEVGTKEWWPFLSILGWIFFVFALAGPSWEQVSTPLMKKEQALVIVLDNSPTMLAEDIKPSRIARAKYKLIDLLKARKEGQTALVVYSGEPYVVAPLTQDTQTLINLLPAISPEIMPTAGQRVDLALGEAAKLIHQTGAQNGEIILITGGFKKSDALQNQLNDLKTQGIQTTIYGIGTSTGSPISLSRGGFLKDENGNMVMAHLDPSYLQKLALAGGGNFIAMTVNNEDIKSINHLLEPTGPWSDKGKDSDQMLQLWRDEGHWVILILLPIVLLLFFRRGAGHMNENLP